jgi:ABC-type phosphate/phosphonate transport system substrate-binding protein
MQDGMGVTAQAFLPMYALPEMAAVNDALWQALRRAVPGLPAALSPAPAGLPEAISAEIVFSQMCGYPLMRMYGGQYVLLGTPLYNLPGCAVRADGMPTHCSFVVVAKNAGFERLADLRAKRFAVNGFDSNSGMNLPRRMIAEIAGANPFFGSVKVTGGHVASMAAVAAGEADAAAIDCVTYGFCAAYRPDLVAGLRVLAQTPASPAIPFISSVATPPEIVEGLAAALVSPGVRAALAGLRIVGVVPARAEVYEAVLGLEREATGLGYPVLA